MNIADNLSAAARYFPDEPALIINDQHISYARLENESNRMASALSGMGLLPGDHAALCAPNSFQWLVIYFGVLKTGAVTVTLSYLLKPDELKKIICDCNPRVIFAPHATIDAMGIEKKGFCRDALPLIISSDDEHPFVSDLSGQGNPDFAMVHRDRHDPAAILYTGGTTGIPKGAILTHGNIRTSVQNVAYYERSAQTDRALCFLPLNHVFAQIHIMNSMVFSAGCIALMSGFDMDRALEAISRHKLTKFYSVPTVFIRLLALDDLAERFRSVRYCFSAAAAMARETVNQWKDRTGLAIHEAYGMTESAAMVTFNHYYRHKIGSVGTPANPVDVRICDDEGRSLPAGSEGEICIHGPNIMKGYLNNPKETERAFRDRWFRSGDIGFLDDEGYLFIVDRLKDMIITGGENVYPREIEELLYTRPEILECAVVGLPHAEYGEQVTAFIVPAKGRTPDAEKLKIFLKDRLASFKVPKEFIMVSELPKNNAGKLLKREIRRQFGIGASVDTKVP